ncbi:putative translation initiation factor IF-2 [Candidatus Lokiarchaeum ossiferum]|uniref:Probable translation initiation factor IF-2 n=1 Tax=Candidatus Lokiarchaeum ossiferum TaxID=2951803 RepID=A0ABY6HNJ0_9ARCH|nr:putative translation initiation factor IF-2 [Candidatus Lokiarchaeum sp. B-35]
MAKKVIAKKNKTPQPKETKKKDTPFDESTKKIRAPIITVLGHIDHGKTSLLDYIRGTVVQKREAAGITQHIGASFFPMDRILDFCKAPQSLRDKITLPGFLVIDTPGHTAFMNLRKRGGAVADAAILVIEMPTGPLQTTWESVRILRDRKVPFILAANKIDRIDGWKSIKDADFLETYNKQNPFTKELLDKYIYETIGLFYEEGFPGIERYDRISDFTQNLAIVPTSALTGEGVPTILIVLLGIIQQYLQKKIKYTDGPAQGVVLEVKKEVGYGITLDTIIFDGHLRKGQKIVVGGLNGPIVSHVRALLTPRDMDEIRDPSKKFLQNDIIYAASGVKILAPDIEDVVAGAPIHAVESDEELEEVIERVREELEAINIETDDEGIILKADTLGSLEAAAGLFRQDKVPIRKAAVGPITKKDVSDAVAAREVDEFSGQICGFNVKILPDAELEAANQGIRVFSSPVVYRVVEEYKEYMAQRRSDEVEHIMKELIMPGKLTIMPQYIFRRSNPVVIGVTVEGGKIIPKMRLINQNGKVIGTLHSITKNNKPVHDATKGDEVAISINGAVLGRNLLETDTLYIKSPEAHIRQLRTRFRDDITPDTLEILIEYVKIMRKVENNSYWAA